MSLQSQYSGLSVDAYRKLEEDTETRYEYHDGEVVAMAGGSYDHTTISGNAFAEITIALREKKNPTDTPCIAANENRKIYIQASNKFLYPDAVVVCGKPMRPENEPSAVSNPTLIVEVLSKSTEAYDRGDKFRYYRQLESFREYLLIHQDKVAVEVWQRQENTDLWRIVHYDELTQEIALSSVQVSISLEALYANVEDLEDLLNKR